MPEGKRLWRTEDSDLVPDGHPDARVLAYGADDTLSEDDVDNVRDLEQESEQAEAARAESERLDAERIAADLAARAEVVNQEREIQAAAEAKAAAEKSEVVATPKNRAPATPKK